MMEIEDWKYLLLRLPTKTWTEVFFCWLQREPALSMEVVSDFNLDWPPLKYHFVWGISHLYGVVKKCTGMLNKRITGLAILPTTYHFQTWLSFAQETTVNYFHWYVWYISKIFRRWLKENVNWNCTINDQYWQNSQPQSLHRTRLGELEHLKDPRSTWGCLWDKQVCMFPFSNFVLFFYPYFHFQK